MINLLKIFACDLTPGSGIDLFGFPTWYKYLEGETIDGSCVPRIDELKDIWLIAFAILEILTRLAGILAVGFIIYGGIKMIMSQGNPDAIKSARDTLINAVIGLVLAIIATGIVNVIAGLFN